MARKKSAPARRSAGRGTLATLLKAAVGIGGGLALIARIAKAKRICACRAGYCVCVE